MSIAEHYYTFPAPVLKQISDSQDFVDRNLGRLVEDSTSVGTTLSNFLAARTQEFIDIKDHKQKTGAEESIAAAADIARGQTDKGGDFFNHFLSQLKRCSWSINNSDDPVSAKHVTSRDAQRVVDKELENWLRLDYYLLAKLAIEGLESDISVPAKDALSALATKKDSDPVTMEFMVGVLDFDISTTNSKTVSTTNGKVIVAFVYFTYELVEALDLYGTKKCANVKTTYKSMSFDWEGYKNGQKPWVEKIFHTDDKPPQFTNERKHCIQELWLPNNVASLTDDVINWVENHVNGTFSIIVKNKKANYEDSAFNLVMLRCIQVYGTLKRHARGVDEKGHEFQTLDIIVFLHVPLWGRVRLGSGSTVLTETKARGSKSEAWERTFKLQGLSVCTLTFDLENDTELWLWCTAELHGPLTEPLKAKVRILDVLW